MTDSQFRDFVVARLDDGDRRFGELGERQESMRADIQENTRITQKALDVSKETDDKVDGLADEVRKKGDARHRENIDRFVELKREVTDAGAAALVAASDAKAAASAAKISAQKTQEDVAGLVAIYDGGKTGVKVVKGIAVGIKGILLYGAGVVLTGSIIVATVLYWLDKGPLPALFGH